MENKNFLHRGACLICGSTDLETKLSQPLNDPKVWTHLVSFYKDDIAPQDVAGVDFNIVRCPKCELYFVGDIPTEAFEERISHFRTSTGVAVPTRQHAQTTHYYADYALEAEKVAVILDRRPHGIEVLEFGSGNGHWLLMAKAYGYETTGVEIREDRIAFAQQNGLSIVRSLEELGNKKFDFIRIDLVLEHLANPLPYLKALADRLKPGGFIRAGVPEGDAIHNVLATYTGTPHKLITPMGHMNCFTHQALVALAAHAGLIPIPVGKLRKAYFKAMWQNRDTKYIGELIKAGRKQRSCTLYLQKSNFSV